MTNSAIIQSTFNDILDYSISNGIAIVYLTNGTVYQLDLASSQVDQII